MRKLFSIVLMFAACAAFAGSYSSSSYGSRSYSSSSYSSRSYSSPSYSSSSASKSSSSYSASRPYTSQSYTPAKPVTSGPALPRITSNSSASTTVVHQYNNGGYSSGPGFWFWMWALDRPQPVVVAGNGLAAAPVVASGYPPWYVIAANIAVALIVLTLIGWLFWWGMGRLQD